MAVTAAITGEFDANTPKPQCLGVREGGTAQFSGMALPARTERLLDHLADHIGGDGTKRPAQMAMPGVVENAGRSAAAYARQHIGHHGTQTGPGHHTLRADAGEALLDPIDKRLDPVRPDIAVVPLNSAVPATRKRSWPRRLVTSLVASSNKLTTGAEAWLNAS